MDIEMDIYRVHRIHEATSITDGMSKHRLCHMKLTITSHK